MKIKLTNVVAAIFLFASLGIRREAGLGDVRITEQKHNLLNSLNYF